MLVATSGDTGGAVAQAFHGVPAPASSCSIRDGRVSRGAGSAVHHARRQRHGGGRRRHVRRLPAPRQGGVRRRRPAGALRLTSANSINIGRLLPQMVYYVLAVARSCPRGAEPVVVVVPSGNFGNLTAGLMRQPLGLPIAQFVAATNVNDVVPRLPAHRPVRAAAVGADARQRDGRRRPSNFERMPAPLRRRSRTPWRATSSACRHDDAEVSADDRARCVAAIGICSIRTAPSAILARWILDHARLVRGCSSRPPTRRSSSRSSSRSSASRCRCPNGWRPVWRGRATSCGSTPRATPRRRPDCPRRDRGASRVEAESHVHTHEEPPTIPPARRFPMRYKWDLTRHLPRLGRLGAPLP